MHRNSQRPEQFAFRPLGRAKTRVRHSHFFGAFKMTQVIFGFFIALAVGLTGIGGGSFTVPLLLLSGLPAAEAVGTTFGFAGVLWVIAGTFYYATKQVHARYAWVLVRGAVPRLVLSLVAFQRLGSASR